MHPFAHSRAIKSWRATAFLFAYLVSPGVVTAQAPAPSTLPREIATEVTAQFNDPGAQRITGRYEVPAGTRIERPLAVIDGPLVIAGTTTGSIVVVNGDIELAAGARVEGPVLLVGGIITGRDQATVSGDVRIYSARLFYSRVGDRLEPRSGDERWWRRRERWARGGWSEVRLVSARTYNRVEGLPVLLGPAFGREFDWGRLSVEALGVLRSNDNFDWNEDNLGHSGKIELDFGKQGGVRVGAKLFDLVAPVEPWHLGDSESGLSAFFLHRDFRDYYNSHGGSLYASLFRRRDVDLGITYSSQRWSSRRAHDPWTLFRDEALWRPNPEMDEGKFHLWNAVFTYDTRNDRRNPWSGWYTLIDVERGSGTIDRYAPTTSVHARTPNGQTSYSRLFLDVRRYNRISPNGQLNLRLATGGWLDGDQLPLQRRFSLGSPGTLPAYRFRNLAGGQSHGSPTDFWQCGSYGSAAPNAPVGVPAECERFMLAQAEFRADLGFDPFGLISDDRDWRRRGWGRSAQFAIFADAGRGWLVGNGSDGRLFKKSELPPLSTFQTDVGVGLILDDVGLYVAKAVSQPDLPANFFIRLRSRF